MLKLAKNQANAKQQLEAELLLSYWIGHILENKQKNKCVCIHEIIWSVIMIMKNRSHRYDISGARSRHGQKYSKYKIVSLWWCLYVLSNT